MKKTRRTFIKHSGQIIVGAGLITWIGCGDTPAEQPKEEETPAAETKTDAMFFKISLAQWSLHKALFANEMDNLDFASMAKNEFGLDAVEYVNAFFKDKAEDTAYLTEMNKRANDNGVKNLLIMIDREGNLGATDDKERTTAIENHYKWVNAAKFLGCHSIRVNAFGEGTPEEVAAAAVDGLGRLSEYAAKEGLNVIVENHGSYSSNGQWLSGVMKQVNMSNCGTLPDFGNFCIKRSGPGFWEGDCVEEYDRYKGIAELMPFAKGVSAKTHDFDENGNETNTDYMKMMKIVKDSGYTGYIDIEYEGSKLSEKEGIMATKNLLEKVGKALS